MECKNDYNLSITLLKSLKEKLLFFRRILQRMLHFIKLNFLRSFKKITKTTKDLILKIQKNL
jgi:hypothetical protein